ncbi:MAG: DUF4157 domain-containing protein [Dehalococcoidia bacterium]
MSRPLPPAVIEELARFRPRVDLEAMRLHVGGTLGRIPPLFRASAMTFGRHVLIREQSYRTDVPWGLALIAHESGHIPQWRELGALRFLFNYARGLVASRFDHDTHPMEVELVAEQRRIRATLEAERGGP